MNENEKLYSAAEVAALIGRTSKAVRNSALKYGIGRKVAGAGWVFTEAEVAEFRPRPPGRPMLADAKPSSVNRRMYRARDRARAKAGQKRRPRAARKEVGHA
jgi:hypothetical protein